MYLSVSTMKPCKTCGCSARTQIGNMENHFMKVTKGKHNVLPHEPDYVKPKTKAKD